mmetsp:Transcript_9599/g.10935  ORF Transcript_9599/g.10935 Transcript_9599/m.10935 type:complete len:360 (+) Transcript_9599:131-1210(+)
MVNESVVILGREIELKWLTLVLLIFQNTLLVLIMRYSRVFPAEDGSLYLTSTAVVMAEISKFFIAIAGVFHENDMVVDEWIQNLKTELIHFDTVKLAVPGLLYTLQNNLLFIALSHLEAAVYQVTYQLKILTTALFSVILLGRQINKYQGISLIVLTIGVAAVQLSNGTSKSANKTEEKAEPILGLICVLCACFSSGFAGVYFEKILKQGRKVSLFMRNVQLSIFGVVLGLLGVYFKDYEKVSKMGFFQGYTNIVCATVLIQAGSGFVIASVMKYADNILKGYATAISIILSSVLCVFLFDFTITMLFVFGTFLVSVSIFLYGYKPADPGFSKVPLEEEISDSKDRQSTSQVQLKVEKS